jgi:hypothetical protein
MASKSTSVKTPIEQGAHAAQATDLKKVAAVSKVNQQEVFAPVFDDEDEDDNEGSSSSTSAAAPACHRRTRTIKEIDHRVLRGFDQPKLRTYGELPQH